MMRPIRFVSVLTVFLCLSAAASSRADFVLNIADIGGGDTEWKFSGSTTILSTSDGQRMNSSGIFALPIWTNGSPSDSNFSSNLIRGSGTVSVNGAVVGSMSTVVASRSVQSFGVTINGLVTANVGDTISWSGDLVVPVFILQLVLGTHQTSTIFASNNAQGLQQTATISTPLVVNVTTGNVPEPSSLLLGAIGGAILIGVRASRRGRTEV